MLVVIAVMVFIATIGFYALKNQDKSQLVINVQRDFLNNMRSVQNNVRNGVGGQSVRFVILTNGSSNYSLSGQTITLPFSVTYSLKEAGVTYNGIKTVCMANPNLSAYTAVVSCSTCISGSGYICTGTVASSPLNLDVIFTNGITTKTVRVEGIGMNIGRIYATN